MVGKPFPLCQIQKNIPQSLKIPDIVIIDLDIIQLRQRIRGHFAKRVRVVRLDNEPNDIEQ